jgi:iron complex outermembrane receptor protein
LLPVSLRVTVFAGLLILLALSPAAKAQSPAGNNSTSLADQTLDQLLNTPVVTVSKRAQKLSKVAAAVYVINREEIRRSGATSLPELLRLAPGVQVARINATQWAVSIRGFSGVWSNKLLVMIDGRTVYSEVFSGVNWEMVDAVLANIDRIEVVRGPGSSVWGANAMNGVINIVTKPATDTAGTTLSASGGNIQKFQSTEQYGGSIGGTAFRLYNETAYESLPLNSTQTTPDVHKEVAAGFRADSTLSPRDKLTVQGNGFLGATTDWEPLGVSLQKPFPGIANIDGRPTSFDLQGKWVRTLSDHSELSLQAFAAHTQRVEASSSYRETTFDFELQHSFTWGDRNSILWGLQARSIGTDLRGTPSVYFTPVNRTDVLTSGFFSDDFTLVPDRLTLSAGVKLEKYQFTGFETEPSVRLAWTPNDDQTVWASVGRAVRIPSVYERDIAVTAAVIPGGLPAVINVDGNPQLQAETLVAYELGYRMKLGRKLSFDTAAYYNHYGKLSSLKAQAPQLVFQPQLSLLLPYEYTQLAKGTAKGLETAVNWDLFPHWRTTSSYSYGQLSIGDASALSVYQNAPGSLPRHQAQLRSYWDLNPKLQLDASAWYVGSLTAAQLPSYTTVDLRLGWHPIRPLELSFSVTNLFNKVHSEGPYSGIVIYTNRVFGRMGSAGVTWRF